MKRIFLPLLALFALAVGGAAAVNALDAKPQTTYSCTTATTPNWVSVDSDGQAGDQVLLTRSDGWTKACNGATDPGNFASPTYPYIDAGYTGDLTSGFAVTSASGVAAVGNATVPSSYDTTARNAVIAQGGAVSISTQWIPYLGIEFPYGFCVTTGTGKLFCFA